LLSVLTGIAANQAAATGQPVHLDALGAGILDRPAAATTGAS
jgi:hypothetical protein